MAIGAEGALSPVTAVALVGLVGVGAQWIAWRFRLPAIVVMLLAGLLIGPVLGLFDPARDFGAAARPAVSLAVAIILFEGGLTLNFRSLSDAAKGVKRLVLIGAPLGWLLSTLALRYGAGLSWEAASVFGGIMIVTGPTVIAPLLRQARLMRRPAMLLQWEAIVNDALGALAAVLAFSVVLVLQASETPAEAAGGFVLGIAVAALSGAAAGYGLAQVFRRGLVPEYMKVPVLFVTLLAVFALSDAVLHESGLLAVTIMGVVIANANLPSYDEIRRFKEHATILLVSGVFVLLAASIDFRALERLDWRAVLFVVLVVLLVRPLTVFAALAGTGLPFREKLLVALTGPRGVVLVAVAGLFGERLLGLGVEDAALIGPLAFVLVAATVTVHGFTLGPFARALGLTATDAPGVLLVGGARWTADLGEALKRADVPVIVADANRQRLLSARKAGLPVFFGDVLSQAAEHGLDLVGYPTVLAASDNDAYNTLVATDFGREVGRETVFQVRREAPDSARHALPATLGGSTFADDATWREHERRAWEGWGYRLTRLTEAYAFDAWRAEHPKSVLVGVIDANGRFRFVADASPGKTGPGSRLLSLHPPGGNGANGAAPAEAAPAAPDTSRR
jgi:NhaP-type Na+/H+ or K+/H+ antiporter